MTFQLRRSGTPDYARIPLEQPAKPEPVPTLLGALVDDMVGEARREDEARDKNPLFTPHK